VNIAPPHLDGGTKLSLKTAMDTWHPELRSLASRRGCLPVTISLPATDGTSVTAMVRRAEGGGVSLIFEEEAQVNLYRGHVNLIAKSEALWTSSVEDWLRTWLGRTSEWLCGSPCRSLADAVALGWTVAHVECAADFTGLVFRDGDQALFTGRGEKRDMRSGGFRLDGTIETFDVGQRGRGRLAVSTHDKDQALRVKRGVTAAGSFYAPTWREHGWDGVAPIRRVEVRASGGALHLHTADGEVIDLREIASLLDPANLHALWRHATTKIHLVQRPTTVTPTFRARRAPIDPRWVAVQRAASYEGGRIFRVSRAPARRLAMMDLRDRTRRALERAIAPLASRLGLAPSAVERLAREQVRAMFDVRTLGPCGAEERSRDVS
jgi:hypothetical protein